MFWWPVSQWVPKLATFSSQYLRIYLSYIIEIWYYIQDGLHNYMCKISAFYLIWVPSCRGVENGPKWFVYSVYGQANARTWSAHVVRFDYERTSKNGHSTWSQNLSFITNYKKGCAKLDLFNYTKRCVDGSGLLFQR